MTLIELAERLEAAVEHANELLESEDTDRQYILEDTLERMLAIAAATRNQAADSYVYAYPMEGENR